MKSHTQTFSRGAACVLIKTIALLLMSLALSQPIFAQSFNHPGALNNQEDLDRMAAKVAEGAEPWKGSWDILVSNTDDFLDDGAWAVETVCVDSANCSNNYMNLARAAAKAYQCALRYHGSGDTAFADKAIYFMNEWAATHTGWDGNTNVSLRAGLYGYQFACAGELMRGYSGWTSADFTAFQDYMLNQFYLGGSRNRDFLDRHHDTVGTHYWANWDHANLASAMAIGVLCDDQEIFDHAINYFYNGIGNANMNLAVTYVHPNGLGQWQESGRDQGHSVMGPQLLGVICEIGWNQGYDLYGALNNRFLSSVEYISKYNTGRDVPFAPYVRDWGRLDDPQRTVYWDISSSSRGQLRPGWDLVYNHYVNRMGMTAPYTGDYAAKTRPEGGGFNYGTGSGGFDGLGFTTLTHSRDPIASGAAPSGLRTTRDDWQVTLSWWGSTYAESYNVKRATTSGGPYETVALVGTKNLFYVDTGLTAGTTYYYVVSANTPGGETANSAETSAIAVAAGGDATQAEDVDFGDGAELITWTTNHNGTGSVVPHETGYIEWTGIDGGDGGPTTLAIRYALGGPNRTGVWTVNGVPHDVLTYSTGDWDIWDERLETVTLDSGTNNTVRITSDGTDAYVYVDELIVKNSTASSPDSVPSAPGNLSATLNGSQIDLSWNSVTNADSYNIKRATSSGGPYVILDNLTGTSYSDSERLYGGTTYYYVVTALNSAGESVDSNEDSVFLPPQNLNATGGDGSVSLDWDDAAPGSDLESYNGYRSTTSGSGYSQIATGVGSSAYSDNNVTNGTAYYYVVTAVNTSSVESDYSNEASAIPSVVFQESNGVVSMEAENGVMGSRWITGSDTGASNDTYVEVDPIHDWTGSSPECTTADCLIIYNFNISTSDNYRFWFRMYSDNAADDSFFWRIDGGSWNLENDRYGIGSWFSTDNAQVDSLAAGDHTLEIAYRENGTRLDKFVIQLDSLSDPSGDGPAESSTSSGDGTPPSAPSGLSATAVSSSQIDLSWTASDGADSYNVKRSTTSGGSYTTIATGVTTTSYSDTGLSASTTYYYVISAVNADGESANSNEASATTASESSPPEAPTGLNATAVSSSAIDLSWTASSGADSYNVKRSTTSGGSYTTIATGVTTTSYSDSGLNASTTYYYVVSAVNADGESANSSEAEATTEAEPSVITDGNYTIIARHSGKALEVANDSTADGANVQQWALDGGANQEWSVTHLANGEHQILGVQSGKSLDVSSASTADGANVIIWPWVDAANQRFLFTATDNDYYRITPVHSGKAIEVDGSSTTDGANVQQWTFNEGLNQQWRLEVASSATALMHVADIQANRVNQGGGQSKAEAVVTVVDDQGNPVSGATVTVTFSGAIAETKSGVTDTSGVTTIVTDGSASNPARTTACVDDIAHSSYTYDSAANVATCDNSYN